MGEKTLQLINNLTHILNENKYLLLQGGVGVGKTYIAKEIAKNLENPDFVDFPNKRKKNMKSEVKYEVLMFHPSYSYEDFIYGVVAEASSGKLVFEYKDKIFVKMVNEAKENYRLKNNKKFVLILDDINRGLISEIMGEAILLMEPHGSQEFEIKLKNGLKLDIPPNFYIIATLNNSIETPFKLDLALKRRFYQYNIESDLEYILDDRNSVNHENNDFLKFYKKVNKLILDHLTHQYRGNELEVKKFMIGHGYFGDGDYVRRIKWQVIPLLRQYIKDGVLEREAEAVIENIEQSLRDNFTDNINLISNNRIKGSKVEITPNIFLREGTTHEPLANIVGRIKEQGLISDFEIENEILFNEQILYREPTQYTMNYSGTLYASEAALKYIKTNKQNPRFLYKKGNIIKVCNNSYYLAGEIQPNEYLNWDEEFINNENYINKRQSTSPNSILFFIIIRFYKTLIKNYEGYLQIRQDDNIETLKKFTEDELNRFVNDYKSIKPLGTTAGHNNQANYEVRALISSLKILWSNIGDIVEVNEISFELKGVYKMSNDNKYQEYLDAMDSLGINQMILQGPPGTSKTYTTREFLKYVGECANEELNKFQITSYDNDKYCRYLENEETEHPPKISWDIVQFHPSYGYEDFIRGIEVGTDVNSEIKYSTVNKTLGKMAELAYANPSTKFFLIVDEINRANLATVFGELIYGLEYRGEGVATPYTVKDSNKLLLPDNLYIIGTMNTADKSIGGIDYAIRRRFLFFSVLPEKEVIMNHKIQIEEEGSNSNENQCIVNSKACSLFENISLLFEDKINPEYYKEDVQIGHTYFLVESEEQLYKRFKYQIIPILREYTKDGVFQLEYSDDTDTINELIKCILGNIDLNNDTKIRTVFEDLINVTEES